MLILVLFAIFLSDNGDKLSITGFSIKQEEKIVADEYGCWGNSKILLENSTTAFIYYQYPDVKKYNTSWAVYDIKNGRITEQGTTFSPSHSNFAIETGPVDKLGDTCYYLYNRKNFYDHSSILQLRSSTDCKNFSNLDKTNIFGELTGRYIFPQSIKISEVEIWYYTAWHNISANKTQFFRIRYNKFSGLSQPEFLFDVSSKHKTHVWGIIKDNDNFYMYYGTQDRGLFASKSIDGVNFKHERRLAKGGGYFKSKVIKMEDEYILLLHTKNKYLDLYRGNSPVNFTFYKNLYNSSLLGDMIKYDNNTILISYSDFNRGNSTDYTQGSVHISKITLS